MYRDNRKGDKMDENLEILTHIYKSAQMGHSSSENLLKELREKDNKIKVVLEEINKEYEKYEKESSKLLKKNGQKPQGSSMMAEFMSKFGIRKEVMNDNSDSSIASTLIEGIMMGNLEIDKKINSYDGRIDKKIESFAKKYKKFGEVSIEKLNFFL